MSISNEAVKAAGPAVERAMRQRTYDRHAADEDVFRESVAHIASAALTAAAPHIQAAALRDAADDMDWRAERFDRVSDNPKDNDLETIIRYGAYAAEARSSAHRLRARAATIEGKSE